MSAFAALSILGDEFFDALVTSRFDLAKRFADRIEASDDFELAVRPECNIVCFRYRKEDDQDAIRTRLRDRGSFFVTRTVLRVACFCASPS